MRRRLQRLALCFSTVILLSTLLLWARSWWVVDGVMWRYGYPSLYIAANRGSLDILRAQITLGTFESFHIPRAQYPPPPWGIFGGRRLSMLGFAYYSGDDIDGPAHDSVPERPVAFIDIVIPLWPFALVSALAPALWLRRTLTRRHRTFRGLCPTCGYDLRASSDRCPECGMPVSLVPTDSASQTQGL
jgi:hypothetical protein